MVVIFAIFARFLSPFAVHIDCYISVVTVRLNHSFCSCSVPLQKFWTALGYILRGLGEALMLTPPNPQVMPTSRFSNTAHARSCTPRVLYTHKETVFLTSIGILSYSTHVHATLRRDRFTVLHRRPLERYFWEGFCPQGSDKFSNFENLQ